MILGSKYLCLDCGEVYDSSHLNLNELFIEHYCPKTDCHGLIVEIDELLIPTIRLLNIKGYYTKFCCSGHFTGQHAKAYILFEEGIKLPTIPKGFKSEVINNQVKIESCDLFRKPTYGDFYKICDNAKTLLKWAISLPVIEE